MTITLTFPTPTDLHLARALIDARKQLQFVADEPGFRIHVKAPEKDVCGLIHRLIILRTRFTIDYA